MRRIAEKLALAAAAPLFALASWASCGGSTTINDQDGGAGASPWADCAGPGECVALTPGCCGVCGAPTLSDVVGVNEDELAAFHAATCTDPNPLGPAGATAVEPNLVAFCKASRCAPIDIRNDAVSACTTDDDCMLRDPDCCEACAVAPFDLVAIAKDKADAYRSEVCRPAESCPACAPIYPTGYAAAPPSTAPSCSTTSSAPPTCRRWAPRATTRASPASTGSTPGRAAGRTRAARTRLGRSRSRAARPSRDRGGAAARPRRLPAGSARRTGSSATWAPT